MSPNRIDQSKFYRDIQILNSNPDLFTNDKPQPANAATVEIRVDPQDTQREVLRKAFMEFARQAGISDISVQAAFADKWIERYGEEVKIQRGGQAMSAEDFKQDKLDDGKMRLKFSAETHAPIIRDLRNIQVEKGLITFSEAQFTAISDVPAKSENLVDSLLRDRWEENQIFDPSQLQRQNLEQKYRDSQYQNLASDPTLGEVALDLTQMGLDIVGIFEPTPFADLSNAGISALRGEWGNAALSVLGVIPYAGDLAKFGKIPKWISSVNKISKVIDKLSDVARLGGKGKEVATAFVREVRRLLNKIPIEKLPDKLKDAFNSLKRKVDDFFAKAKKADNPKQPDIEPPKKPDIEKQKKLEKLKAERAETEAKRKLQEGIKEAEAKGKIKKLPEADRKWIEGDPRRKELAYDPDTKDFNIGEARAAIKAEQAGILSPPVKRAIDEYGGSRGGDYIDASGKYWDIKDARINDLPDLVEKLIQGENILIDARKISTTELQKLETAIKAKLPASTKGELKFLH